MGTKPKQTKVEVKKPVTKPKAVTEVKPVVEKQPEQSFAERTQELQPWLGTEAADTSRPAPQVVK